MNKKLIASTLTLALTMLVTGCSQGSVTGSSNPRSSQESAPNLVGDWKQENPGTSGPTQSAKITATTIEINWILDDDTTAIYWIGSFDAPEEDKKYTWTSVKAADKTASAMLASGDDTKEFTYEAGVISYSSTILGVTKKMRLKKVSK